MTPTADLDILMSDSNKTEDPTGVSRRSFISTAAGAATAVGVGSLATAESARGGEPGRLIVDGLNTSLVNDEFIGLVRKGETHCVHMSVSGADSVAALYGFIAARSDELVMATTVRDIRTAHREGRISFVMGSQHAKRFEEPMMEVPLGSLDLLAPQVANAKAQGIGVQGIVYNTYNVFGSGCLNHKVPLSRAGRRLVEEIHKNQIVLDVGGHCGEQTSLDAIEMTSGVPVVCTHTNMAGLNSNMRAISDRTAEAIAKTGGVIGLTAISDFHVRSRETASIHGKRSPRATLDDYLEQFDYARALLGVDHIGIGSDFPWGWGETFEMIPSDSLTFPPHALSEGHVETVEGFADSSELPNVIAGLRDRGWREDELDKVLGENWLRVYEQVWGA